MQDSQSRQQERKILQYLSSLSYREGDLHSYLDQVARGVSELMEIDWSVVTLYQGEFDRLLASSIDIGEAADQLYPLHGTVTQTVVQTGCPLTIKDSDCESQYGQTPEGYRAYLGVPLDRYSVRFAHFIKHRGPFRRRTFAMRSSSRNERPQRWTIINFINSRFALMNG